MNDNNATHHNSVGGAEQADPDERIADLRQRIQTLERELEHERRAREDAEARADEATARLERLKDEIAGENRTLAEFEEGA